jgi:hypothetical protein
MECWATNSNQTNSTRTRKSAAGKNLIVFTLKIPDSEGVEEQKGERLLYWWYLGGRSY